MCLISKPKTVTAAASSSTDVPVLRNPYLDGIDPIIRARSTGVRSLRIDRPGAGLRNPALPTQSPLTIQPASAADGGTQVVKPTGRSASSLVLSRLAA